MSCGLKEFYTNISQVDRWTDHDLFKWSDDAKMLSEFPVVPSLFVVFCPFHHWTVVLDYCAQLHHVFASYCDYPLSFGHYV